MENKYTNRKVAVRLLIMLAVCLAILLLCIPFGAELAPLGRAIWNALGDSVGYPVWLLILFISGCGAVYALSELTELVMEKLQIPVNGKKIISGLCLIVLGAVFLCAGTWLARLGGLALAAFGGLVFYRVIREIRAAQKEHPGGKTIFAEIINITKSSDPESGAVSYTVFCQTGDGVLMKKTSTPLDAGCIGKRVPIRFSAFSPEVFEVDLEHMV